jgi:hypothetical protein
VFSGDLSQLARFQDRPTDDYELKESLVKDLATLERIGQLNDQARELTARLQEIRGDDPATFRTMDQIINTYEEILRLESSESFTLAGKVQGNLDKLKEVKSQQIRERVQAPVSLDPSLTGKLREIEELLQQRKKLYDLIALFPPEARINRDNEGYVQELVPDDELRGIFMQALRDSEATLVDVAQIVTNSSYDRDPDILQNRSLIFQRAMDTTFADDTYSINRLQNLERTVESIVGGS